MVYVSKVLEISLKLSDFYPDVLFIQDLAIYAAKVLHLSKKSTLWR